MFRNRRRRILVVGALLCLSSSLAIAGDVELPFADTIRSVWSLSIQPCNGGGANAMRRSPDQAKVQESKIVELPSLGVRFRVPQLPDVTNTHIKIYLGDRSRGVIDNYVLFSEQDLSPAVAAVVVTELPPEFDSADKVLSTVRSLETQLSRDSGLFPRFEKINGPYGASIEMFVQQRVSTDCFPTSRFQMAPGGVETLGISRFAFTMGKLVEFALILRIPSGMKVGEAEAYARKVMDGYWLGLKPM